MHSPPSLTGRSTALAMGLWLSLVSAASPEAIWVTGPEVRYPLDAIYRHADGDIDGDGSPDVGAFCSMDYFVIMDGTWPGKASRMSATLSVGSRSYIVEAERIEYDPILREILLLPNPILMAWPAEEAPDFGSGGAVRVHIDSEERDYGEGASAALDVVREQCVRNVRGQL